MKTVVVTLNFGEVEKSWLKSMTEHHRVSFYLWVAASCQARAPAGSQVRSMTADSMDSILHPVENATRISSCVTRRGPQSPGWRSLKQSM